MEDDKKTTSGSQRINPAITPAPPPDPGMKFVISVQAIDPKGEKYFMQKDFMTQNSAIRGAESFTRDSIEILIETKRKRVLLNAIDQI